MSGRLLCYVAPRTVPDMEVVTRAAGLTAAHPGSGLVVRGPHAAELLRCFGRSAPPGVAPQPMIVDPGYWTKTVATMDTPMGDAAADDVLFSVSLDAHTGPLLESGADAVLTPSGFVRARDWPALEAVLAAGAEVGDRRVATLVATDAAMLDPAPLATFLSRLERHHGGRPLAFVFAGTSLHLERDRRVVGLRELLAAFPGSMVVGVEVLTGTDVLVHGGVAAVGFKASQRLPRPPGTKGGGPQAADFIPGMFLRDLWETRSPTYYADWYRNRRSAPVCGPCGRGPQEFTPDPLDRDAVLIHNVHAWLDVLTDLRREGQHARTWLSEERWRARDAHDTIGPRGSGAPVSKLLQALCDLDGRAPERDRAAIG